MRILVADPDKARRRRIAELLAAQPGISISELCSDLTETFNAVEHRPPTLVLVAGDLADLPEFEMMEILFRTLSVRWAVLAGRLRAGGLNLDGDDVAFSAALRNCVAGGLLNRQSAPSAGAGLLQSVDPGDADRLILIGSSTGGVDALMRVLGAFPVDCPPTLIVQHTGAAYSAGLARLLDRHVQPEVHEAVHGAIPRRGQVLLASGAETHLELEDGTPLRCCLTAGPKINGHRPSVDALFRSAVPVAKRVTAALLTGMGRDGAEGLLALRRAGARTICQDRATSVVYGMPGAAMQLGAADHEMPLSAIGAALLQTRQGIRA